ncbi:transposase [Bradyrhizobium sp. BR 1433]|uniref:transposase n=1 Tax=Bradyrhizobium sp. BR 1433 TaxID=3447967 RepID=UPI003EE4ECD0
MNSGQEVPKELACLVAMRRKSLSPQKLRSNTFRTFLSRFVEAMDDDTIVGDYGLGAQRRAQLAGGLPLPAMSARMDGRAPMSASWRRDPTKDERPAEWIAQRMDFCRAAKGAADRLIVLPLPPEL